MSKVETTKTKQRVKLGKALTLRSPFVTTHVGMYVHGVIEIFGQTSAGKFGVKETVTIRLKSACEWTDKKTREVITVKEGDAVRLEIKAGLAALSSLKPGTEVTIECVGRVDVGKGQDAYTYEVTHE